MVSERFGKEKDATRNKFLVLSENDYKARLISAVKKEVKQVMEESVTRKFVHEESGSVTSLCGAVEACLSQGITIGWRGVGT